MIEQLSKDLKSEFPEMKGFSTRKLNYMRLFAEDYPNVQIVQEVLAQLTWYHKVTLLDKVKDKDIRLFYILFRGSSIESCVGSVVSRDHVIGPT